MAVLAEVLEILNRVAPPAMALPDDPIGLLIGSDLDLQVHKIGVCLDATPGAVRRATAEGIDLLIAHHPLIYRPLKRLDSDPVSQAVTSLVKADIALYAMHTNWDSAKGGINDTLAGLLDLKNVRRLGEEGLEALPRLGHLSEALSLADFIRLVQKAIACTGMCALRVNEIDLGTMISQVAVCGGAGAELAAAVQAAGADAFVTSDVRHHEFLDASGRGLALLDAGHQATEAPGMRALISLLTPRLPEIKFVWLET